MERVTDSNEMHRSGSGTRRHAQGASLSVVLLSEGDCTALERALACIASPCRRLDAEIIVVRAKCSDDSVAFDTAYPSVVFLEAPATSSRSERREIGISRAAGDIVAVRIDGEVGDTLWLSAFDRVVGASDEVPFVERDATPKPTRGDETAMGERRRQRPSTRSFAPVRREWGTQPMLADVPAQFHVASETTIARVREM